MTALPAEPKAPPAMAGDNKQGYWSSQAPGTVTNSGRGFSAS